MNSSSWDGEMGDKRGRAGNIETGNMKYRESTNMDLIGLTSVLILVVLSPAEKPRGHPPYQHYTTSVPRYTYYSLFCYSYWSSDEVVLKKGLKAGTISLKLALLTTSPSSSTTSVCFRYDHQHSGCQFGWSRSTKQNFRLRLITWWVRLGIESTSYDTKAVAIRCPYQYHTQNKYSVCSTC